MTQPSLRLISWNINGRVTRLDRHITALASRQPDIVALQEVRASAVDTLVRGLAELGLPEVVETATTPAARRRRQCGLLVASRWPLTPLPPAQAPYPESIISVEVARDGGAFELHAVHIPNGANHGWKKIDTFEAIYTRLATPSDRPRILCGDFNSPQDELADGQVVTWGQDWVSNTRYITWTRWRDRFRRIGTGEQWDAGERNVLRGLAEFDLHDVYRLLNGYGDRAWSWRTVRAGRRIGRRFDHIFASRALNPQACTYLGELWSQRLSDHLPIEASFAP